jgi:hypothetical protein
MILGLDAARAATPGGKLRRDGDEAKINPEPAPPAGLPDGAGFEPSSPSASPKRALSRARFSDARSNRGGDSTDEDDLDPTAVGDWVELPPSAAGPWEAEGSFLPLLDVVVAPI